MTEFVASLPLKDDKREGKQIRSYLLLMAYSEASAVGRRRDETMVSNIG